MPKTLGELRVRVDFNVSASSDVDVIKKDSAELIDKVDILEKNNDFSSWPPEKIEEFKRLTDLAKTAYENACMWAVKALTI